MNDALLRLYHRAPYALRVLMASTRGFRLRRWRYGPETETLVAAALERDHWSAARWAEWQHERLQQILHRAATQVPYYRHYWQERRKCGDNASWELLAHWPILSKDTVRQQPQAFVADDCDIRKMQCDHSSGTTGKPMTLWRSRATSRAWYALFEARLRRWNGVSQQDRWAILGGQLVAPFRQNRPPYWVWNAGLNQLYMSTYHLAPDHTEAYIAAMQHYRVRYMLGYPSAMYALAQSMLVRGVRSPTLNVALSNAEPLFDHQREVIEQAFGCAVRNTYGMSEMVGAGSECSAGTFHLWPEVGMIEVLGDQDDTVLAPGQVGRFVTTGLLDADMPLIRYEVGDRGAIADEGALCACGRHLPALARLEGRMDDVIVTADGRLIGRLDPVFKGNFHLREAQIIQESLTTLRVLYVPTEQFSAHEQHALLVRLRDRVGDMQIQLEAVDQIPRSANGKFRAVISHVSRARLHE
jgi:phenylacetate-CoA ligase